MMNDDDDYAKFLNFFYFHKYTIIHNRCTLWMTSSFCNIYVHSMNYIETFVTELICVVIKASVRHDSRYLLNLRRAKLLGNIHH
jgi:hypothetical protein